MFKTRKEKVTLMVLVLAVLMIAVITSCESGNTHELDSSATTTSHQDNWNLRTVKSAEKVVQWMGENEMGNNEEQRQVIDEFSSAAGNTCMASSIFYSEQKNSDMYNALLQYAREQFKPLFLGPLNKLGRKSQFYNNPFKDWDDKKWETYYSNWLWLKKKAVEEEKKTFKGDYDWCSKDSKLQAQINELERACEKIRLKEEGYCDRRVGNRVSELKRNAVEWGCPQRNVEDFLRSSNYGLEVYLSLAFMQFFDKKVACEFLNSDDLLNHVLLKMMSSNMVEVVYGPYYTFFDLIDGKRRDLPDNLTEMVEKNIKPVKMSNKLFSILKKKYQEYRTKKKELAGKGEEFYVLYMALKKEGMHADFHSSIDELRSYFAKVYIGDESDDFHFYFRNNTWWSRKDGKDKSLGGPDFIQAYYGYHKYSEDDEHSTTIDSIRRSYRKITED